jgi:hypothetical protein
LKPRHAAGTSGMLNIAGFATAQRFEFTAHE